LLFLAAGKKVVEANAGKKLMKKAKVKNV